MKKFLSIVTAAVLVTACAAKKEIKEDQTLLNGNWELAKASYSKDIAKDYPEGLPTLTFDSSDNLSVFGYDGCNRINTKATLKKDNQIAIAQEVASTMMACKKVKSTEYVNALTNSTTYSLKNNVLVLKNENTELTFYKVTLNGNWYLDKIYVGKIKAADLFPYKKPFIKIDINQPVFSGNSACNAINGQLLMFQNTMKFNHITSTKMFCDGVNEKVFTDALEKVTHYKLEGARLILLEKDKKIMELIQQYE
ncbi:META domain-containing protein [Flavobacterium sp. xlx-214]|uniref:META domain-containing protein n=1 Tax=unclassified Flavobacterium TaxID=196869 RepID=UPI0013D604FC|nr:MULTISPECIES: META domain-containing protein [unclassified Flavobacterium]MBA5793827.1 META domain-containing protein [Flavobacterium sp. xlx-221]QMI84871.1 META domain-containing protein [Flavobacterium sp. xlx-214]